jgi:hypothetical protein
MAIFNSGSSVMCTDYQCSLCSVGTSDSSGAFRFSSEHSPLCR